MDGSPRIRSHGVRGIELVALGDAIRSIEDDALAQQARLAQAPLPKERRRRRWPHRAHGPDVDRT